MEIFGSKFQLAEWYKHYNSIMCTSYYFDRYCTTSKSVKFGYKSTFLICLGSIILLVQTSIADDIPI
jgi:hypothetical protein